MASINTIVKRKQYLWLGIVVVGAASAIGGALYLSDVDMSGNGEAVAEQEPVPDMTGVVDTTFDDKVRQHATTEMQVTAAQMQKQYEEIRRELDVLNKQRGDDQRRIEKLGQDNAALAEQVKALGANPVTATGEPVFTITRLRTFAAWGITATAGNDCPGADRKSFCLLLGKKFCGMCISPLDWRRRLWLSMPPATGA